MAKKSIQGTRRFEVEGMDEVLKALKYLDELPRKCVIKSAKAGIIIVRKEAKDGGWVDQTGNLRKGIVDIAEKTNKKGKKVYQVTMDRKMNDVFQKKAVHATQTRTYHGYNRTRKDTRQELKQYYYPASIEYGFKTRNGGWVPGFYFLKSALVNNKSRVEKAMVEVLASEIDKLK